MARLWCRESLAFFGLVLRVDRLNTRGTPADDWESP